MLDKANSAEATDVGEWKQSCAALASFLFRSPTSILHLSSLISITFSLIRPPPSLLHSILLHLALFLSLSFCLSLQRGKNKQLPGLGWPMNFKWLWRAKALTDFLLGKRSATRLEKKKKQCQINMVQSKCASTQSCTLNQYGILISPASEHSNLLKVEVHESPGLSKWLNPTPCVMPCSFLIKRNEFVSSYCSN